MQDINIKGMWRLCSERIAPVSIFRCTSPSSKKKYKEWGNEVYETIG